MSNNFFEQDTNLEVEINLNLKAKLKLKALVTKQHDFSDKYIDIEYEKNHVEINQLIADSLINAIEQAGITLGDKDNFKVSGTLGIGLPMIIRQIKDI